MRAMSGWTPATIAMQMEIFSRQMETETLTLLGDFDHQDHLHREMWELRHELQSVKKSLGI